jgi:hypothetical protein
MPRVVDLRAYVPDSTAKGTDYTDQETGHWIVDAEIVNPSSVNSEYNRRRIGQPANTESFAFDGLKECASCDAEKRNQETE